ncbi:MAG: DUF1080 domain-containing protein [Balneolaceae bacterium]|nr:DUF1080 domain-containing protein [Balneolaceae bacterium]
MSMIHTVKCISLLAILTMIILHMDSQNAYCQEKIQINESITPTETIELFNRKDLTGFYTWLVDFQFEDPTNVFSVVDQIDGAPAIRISGEHFGGLITEKSYTNYHLIVEFRWGAVTYEPRMNRSMDSGILLHAQGPEGNSRVDFNGPWMRSIEYQIIEGGTGDFILIGGYEDNNQNTFINSELTSLVRQNYNHQYVWDPRGDEKKFEGTIDDNGRIFWFGRDPEWSGELGFRGLQDIENPLGKWNRIEAICEGNTFIFLLNGVIVNKGFNSNLTEGQLLFQSEGAEIYFRRIELRPLE